jgi:hypothetical protein
MVRWFKKKNEGFIHITKDKEFINGEPAFDLDLEPMRNRDKEVKDDA